MKFVIEHLDKRLFSWSYMEYKHISEVVGKKNIIFTHVNGEKAKEQLKAISREVHKSSVVNLGLKNICVLDPQAKQELSPADNKFDFFIFGGVLGDFPPRGRTQEALTFRLDCETRSLGNKQMSTDTAVIVASRILAGVPCKFVDEPEINIQEGQAVMLPFRYLEEDGKPVFPEGFVEFMKKRRDF